MTIPVTIIGGYLGAGKTTLVNRLLRNAGGLRLAVLVNDFGALPIDADLIEARDGDLLSIAGGCICCSYGSDLVAALIDLGARHPAPEHLVIETSGVALPGAVAQSIGLVAGLSLDGIAVAVDAETIVARAGDRYLADTITRQIDAADLLVLTKLDLLDPVARDGRRGWMREHWPDTRIVEAIAGDVPPAVLLGRHREEVDDTRLAPMTAHEVEYVTIGLHVPAPVAPEALATALAAADPALLRAKGFVTDRTGATHAIQIVGRRGASAPATTSVTMPDHIMCIGLSTLSPERLVVALRTLAPVRIVAVTAPHRWPHRC